MEDIDIDDIMEMNVAVYFDQVNILLAEIFSDNNYKFTLLLCIYIIINKYYYFLLYIYYLLYFSSLKLFFTFFIFLSHKIILIIT